MVKPPSLEKHLTRGRTLLWPGAVGSVLLPIIYLFQVYIGLLTTPWYLPILGTIAFTLCGLSLLLRKSKLRILLFGIALMLAIAEWLFIAHIPVPKYTGTVQVGSPVPEFTTTLASGVEISSKDLIRGKKTVIVVFRGRWCPFCLMELKALDKNIAEFKDRKVRLIVLSVDDVARSLETQKDFPNLTVVADPELKLVTQLGLIHPKGGPEGQDIAAPTTFLIDGNETVKWIYRTDTFAARLSVWRLLGAVDEYLSGH